MRLKLGARRSDLARLQAFEVGRALMAAHPSVQIEYVFSESLGDKNLTDPLWKMPEKGVFTEDLSRGLRDGSLDLVVHSWKDLPVEDRPDSLIAATLSRADARDLILVKRDHFPMIKEDRTLRLFSSSPRREYNLRPFLIEAYPGGLDSVEFHSVRGNIQTRVRKLMESESIDGLVVAKAAMDRLLTTTDAEFAESRVFLKTCLDSLEWMIAPLCVNPGAAAQGALAVEIPSRRKDLSELLESINSPSDWRCVIEERRILKSHGGGCHQKIGVTILERPEGRISFVRGETDNGSILRERRLDTGVAFPEGPVRLVKTADLFERTPVEDPLLPKGVNALCVSHSEAFPKTWSWQGPLWTAGWTTWRKLAARGLWVNGCSEGLGLREDPRIGALAPDLAWATLTHDRSKNEGWGVTVPTYRLVPRSEGKPLDGEVLHWSSALLYEEALTRWPRLSEKRHSCGPGATWRSLKDRVPDILVKWPFEENI